MIPHDFDMKEFIKWNVEDYFTPLMATVSKWMHVVGNIQRHNYHMFMVAVERHSLELLKQGIRRHLCRWT